MPPVGKQTTKPVCYVTLGSAIVEIVDHELMQEPVPCIMLSANNTLKAGHGWSLRVQQDAGPTYERECRWRSYSSGLGELQQGSAIVMGGGSLYDGFCYRWVVQAITIHYDAHSYRTPATPQIVYHAVRAGLEKAEAFSIPEVATYLMCQSDGFGTASGAVMAEALFHALLDHAAIAVSVNRLVVCEPDAAKLMVAQSALRIEAGKRGLAVH